MSFCGYFVIALLFGAMPRASGLFFVVTCSVLVLLLVVLL